MTALDLYDLGLSLFPCEPKSKQPSARHLPKRYDEIRQRSVATWKPFQTERATRENIEAWFVRARLNPAVVTGQISGIAVIDPDANDAIRWCERLPDTPFIVRTARGCHLYYRYAPGLPAFIYPDDQLRIEIKSDGRYVMAPGAIHPSGQVYQVRGGCVPGSLDDLPPFPLEFVVDHRTVKSSGIRGDGYEFPDAVFAGERHHELFKLVRSLKGLGADIDTARHAARLANEHRCQPPLREDQFDRSGFEAWFSRVWHQPDRPLDPLGGRVPLNIDTTTAAWL